MDKGMPHPFTRKQTCKNTYDWALNSGKEYTRKKGSAGGAALILGKKVCAYCTIYWKTELFRIIVVVNFAEMLYNKLVMNF